ncbi:TetR family transcriptional regulator [Hamadaea sp. NPDC050747]|uniref:TetR/AcrR family transcriptional regulator n=1 Tax=Hamadaea sp. NPDC050747 TaxID=3155789 RepID=UPI00340603BF
MTPRGTARSSLIASAIDLIAARGVNAVGVDAIAGQAGTTKRTLYLHFPGKDALVAEALTVRSAGWHDQLTAAVSARAADPEGQLLAVFDLLSEAASGPGYRGCMFVNAAADLPDPDHPARPVASLHKRRLLDFITTRTVAMGVRDPEALARQLKVLMEGAVATALVDPGPQPALDARAAAVVLIAAAQVHSAHVEPAHVEPAHVKAAHVKKGTS